MNPTFHLNRREWLGATAAAALGIVAGGCHDGSTQPAQPAPTNEYEHGDLRLLPYPQVLVRATGSLPLGKPRYLTHGGPSPTTAVAMDCLHRRLSNQPNSIPVRLGSVEEGYDAAWLAPSDNEFLDATDTSAEASVVTITPVGITVVGKGKWGMLYGVQTICQLIEGAAYRGQTALPCLSIRDSPDLKWRCLAPTLAWYSGWNRLEGYDLCNWTEDEWKWLADWSLLHKCNAWAVCMYGYWPFRLPQHPKETLDVDSFFYNPKTGKKEPRRFTHRNIQREFFPEVIRYANERGIQVHAYIGKNSFNGCEFRKDPKIYAGGAAELLPFAPDVDAYWGAFIRRIVELGFNGFVFEDPEAYHVPNQSAQCYDTFWKPWADRYGFSSVKQTDANHPPLGVHIEYYTWLYRTFARKIRDAARGRGTTPAIYLISHVLLARIMAESKTPEERRRWIDLVDQRHGERVPFVIAESNEAEYVKLLGGDRVASLGGRGGSCTCAMRRIASVNNDWEHGGMGGDLAYERDCQQRIVKAGGFGAMAYIFEWTNTESFAYLGAQHLWRSAGIPGVSNTDQVGILDYAYRLYYGDAVGRLVARAMDGGSDVNDAMVLEGVYGSQYPSTGKALHRDYQLLAALADRAEQLARQAYRLYAGRDPELYKAAYDEDAFRWAGYDRAADRTFKTERLRLLWLSTRRSQEMCQTALAHRKAQRLIAEGGSLGAVLEQLDRALAHARSNQLIYQCNYYDDYDPTDGLCSFVTARLEADRARFVAHCGGAAGNAPELNPRLPVPPAVRAEAEAPVLFIPWEKLTDILPTNAAEGDSPLALSFSLGLAAREDFFCLGVVFTVEIDDGQGGWRVLFRRAIDRRSQDWEHWSIPIAGASADHRLRLRFTTDSYSRAQDRTAPTWTWALWGQPQLHRRSSRRDSDFIHDFIEHIGAARRFVRLDRAGKDRPFDHGAEDSTGAAFTPRSAGAATAPSAARRVLPAIAAFTPHLKGQFGLTIAEYDVSLA